MDAFRAMSPPSGLIFTPMFSEELSGETRAARLEQEVQQLRNDFDTTVPMLVRLAAIEQDIKDLVTQLESLAAQDRQDIVEPPLLLQEEAMEERVEQPPRTNALLPDSASAKGAVKPSSPTIAPAAPVAAKQAAPSASATSLRVGDHLDKTRLVFDVSGKPVYQAWLENGGTRLIVEVAGIDWTGARRWDAASAALVAGYTVEKMQNGEKFAIDLLAPAAIRLQEVLDPAAAGKPFRLVIDLFAQGVHNG